jgi:hypothetical protein
MLRVSWILMLFTADATPLYDVCRINDQLTIEAVNQEGDSRVADASGDLMMTGEMGQSLLI